MKKYKNFLVGIIFGLAFISTASSLSNSHVEAASNRAKLTATSSKPRKVILTKNVKIYKEKVDFPLYKVRLVSGPKTLKKGTIIKTMGGGMHFHWFVIKKGYTHSGLSLNSNYSKIKKGYVWVVDRFYTDASWFKLK